MEGQREESDKLSQSVRQLEQGLKNLEKRREDAVYLAGVSKIFETTLEHAWKHLKRRVIDEGIEVYSPKETIKHAGRMGVIDNVEKWLQFLESRNLAVHDYLGVSDEEYLETIRAFLPEVKKLTSVKPSSK